MKKYSLQLDSPRCIGCHGCEVHCKTSKNLPVGPILCDISFPPLQKAGNIPRTEFVFFTCQHCEDPLCVPACPKDAIIKRPDGIVFIEEDRCIGCMACRRSCPYEIPEFNPATNKAVKCDLCKDRLDRGLKPACVTKCTTHALKLVKLEAV